MRTITFILLCQFLLSGCSNTRNSALDPVHQNRLLQNQRISIGNEFRDYHLYLPVTPATAPIVFLFHGNGGSSDQLLGLNGFKAPYKVWLDIALRENLILVVPNGLFGSENRRGWNDCRVDAPTNPISDDVQFFNSLLDQVKRDYSSGDQAVFASGISNGGLMVSRLADETPQKLSGIAIVVASRPVNTECASATEPLPVLVMNGTDDPLLPYEGGQIASVRGEVFSTIQAIDHWVQRNNAELVPIETSIPNNNENDGSTINKYTYEQSTDGARVELYEVVNGGHTEPSVQERYSNIFKRIVGSQNGDLEMAEEVWGFFKSLLE